jgi:hypothetical protein
MFTPQSLTELVEAVRRGEDVAADALLPYQSSENAAERFLAHEAGASLGLADCHAHLMQALAAIGHGDRRVLEQFIGLCGFLGRESDATEPTVAFAEGAVRRGDVNLGIEAAASAAAQDAGRGGTWATRGENLRRLAELYATAVEKEADFAGGEWTNEVPHVAVLTSSLGDDEPAARAVAALAEHVDAKKIKISAYATEGYVRRDSQQWAGWPTNGSRRPRDAAPSTAAAWINHGRGASPTPRRGGKIIARLQKAKIAHYLAPTDGTTLAAARSLAEKLAADRVDVLLVDADASDAVAGLVSSWRVARRLAWVARHRPLMSRGVGSVIYLDEARRAADAATWDELEVPTAYVAEGVDLNANAGQIPQRRTYGIPEAAVILTTAADDVDQAIGKSMRHQISELLTRQPQAVYLIIGGGDTTTLRRHFEAAGVGRRVGYAGPRRDADLLASMGDIYVPAFGTEAASPVLLSTMARGTAICGVGDGLADVAGEAATHPEHDWIDRAAKLVREGAERRRVGEQVRKRAEQRFGFARTARAIEKLVAGLVNEESLAMPRLDQAELREAA